MRTWHLVHLLSLGLAGALLCACAAEPTEEAVIDEQGATGGIAERTPEARAVLRLANEADEDTLRDPTKVGLRAISSMGIIATRLGDDEVPGTDDDIRFDTLAQLDAVPFVGPPEFRSLLAHARALGYVETIPLPCSWEHAFKARYGQDFRVDDVSFVTSDGQQTRGIGSLGNLAVTPPYPGIGGHAVQEIRLLGTEVYSVLATRSRPEELVALGHAIGLSGDYADWARRVVPDVLLRLFAMDAPTWSQSAGMLRALALEAEARIPVADLTDYRAALETWIRPFETGDRALPVSGETYPRNGEGTDFRTNFTYVSTNGKRFGFLYSTYWGLDPTLGVKLDWSWGPTWVGLPALPKCEGRVTGSYAGATYAFFETAKNWVDAEETCMGLGGHLASVHKRGQQGFLRSLAPNAGSTWIGLVDRLENGVFSWSDEQSVSWLNWMAGEPNNWGPGEHCVEQADRWYQPPATQWNDAQCSHGKSFICRLP